MESNLQFDNISGLLHEHICTRIFGSFSFFNSLSQHRLWRIGVTCVPRCPEITIVKLTKTKRKTPWAKLSRDFFVLTQAEYTFKF